MATDTMYASNEKPKQMLDRERYREAYALYRQWNEAEAIAHRHHRQQASPLQSWERYIDLVELCWQLHPKPTEQQRDHKMVDIEQYYERVRKLEAWRTERGKAT